MIINIAHAAGNVLNQSIVTCGGPNQPECTIDSLWNLGYILVNYTIELAFLIATLVILFSGFKLITAAGNPKVLEAAKAAMTAAVVGIVIILSGWIIVNTFISTFTNCTGAWNVFGTPQLRCGGK